MYLPRGYKRDILSHSVVLHLNLLIHYGNSVRAMTLWDKADNKVTAGDGYAILVVNYTSRKLVARESYDIKSFKVI